MKSGIKFLLTVSILIFFIVTAVHADTVVLKNGRELKVEKTWQEGDQLRVIFHGIKAGIPQSKIMRVESDSDDQVKTIDRKRAVTPTKRYCTLEKDGFCDLQWGCRVSSVDGLEKKQAISDLDDVIEYVRPKDLLKIGEATLKSIIYAFWRDQLYTVTIWAEGYSNFTALRDAVFTEFGPGQRNHPDRERYIWSDMLSDMMLEYIQDGQYGMLWLRSKEMDRQCRSSQLKGHASYLKWMKSRD